MPRQAFFLSLFGGFLGLKLGRFFDDDDDDDDDDKNNVMIMFIIYNHDLQDYHDS